MLELKILIRRISIGQITDMRGNIDANVIWLDNTITFDILLYFNVLNTHVATYFFIVFCLPFSQLFLYIVSLSRILF